MKYLLLAVLIIAVPCIRAQKPEKIYPNAREHKSIPYLKEQAAAWKKVITAEPKNVEAWYNYYYANRNLNFNDTTDKRSVTEKETSIKQLIDEMGKNIPDSYEYNLCKWMSGGWDMKLIPYLKKAQELGENRTEHLDYSIVLAEMERNIEKRDLYVKLKHKAGQFSSGMLYYNYNVLIGLPLNSILLTAGDNDTFPIWYLQSLGIRRDVTIIHLHLIGIKEYAEPIYRENGIDYWKVYQGTNQDTTKIYKASLRKDFIKQMAANAKNRPVCIALTAPLAGKCDDSVKEKLYLTGLSYQYSNLPIDNMALLKRNFEKFYKLDYVETSFFDDISPALVSHINSNYIIPMLKLFDHYKASGDNQKEEWIKSKLLAISKGKEEEKQIKEHLALKQD